MANMFQYIARDSNGQRVTGTLSGQNQQVILAELQERKLAPVRVTPVRERVALRRRISTRQLSMAYRQLGDLLRAGVPLLRALRLLGRSKSNPRLAAVMTEVADEVADGAYLADAMAQHSDVFPDVQIAMVRAGERGGFLEQVLDRMSTFLEHQADTRGKIIGNMIYPAMLLLVGLGIVIVALVVFVPQFRDFYTRIDVPLPTQILLAASELMQNAWLFLILVAIALCAGFWWLWRRPAVQRKIVAWQLKVPKLGPLVQSVAVSRFSRILGTLLENGIPLIAALQISRDATGNILLEEAIDRATEAVRAGETLAQPLAESGMFADDVVEMISVGESANNLDVVLLNIAETIEKRVDRMLSVMLRLIEPLLLLLMAGVVLFIFIALIVPLLKLSDAV